MRNCSQRRPSFEMLDLDSRKKVELHSAQASMLPAMEGYLAAQDKEQFAHYDRLHGLLNYALATNNDVPGAVKYLFAELCDYKAAKTREQRAGIAKMIRVVLDSDEIKGMDEPVKSTLLSEYSRSAIPNRNLIFTPNSATRFMRRTTPNY